jgi:hypothetical protein
MLVGKRRLGKTLLERHMSTICSRMADPIGCIEYSAGRDRIDVDGEHYSIVSERTPMTLLEHAIRLLAWRWKDLFALRDDAGRLIAVAEKSSLNIFLLHRKAAIFSIRPRSRGCLEICRQCWSFTSSMSGARTTTRPPVT